MIEFNDSDRNHLVIRYETDILDQSRLLSLLPTLYDLDLSDDVTMRAVDTQINKRTSGRGRSNGPWDPADDEEVISNEVRIANGNYLQKSLDESNLEGSLSP